MTAAAPSITLTLTLAEAEDILRSVATGLSHHGHLGAAAGEDVVFRFAASLSPRDGGSVYLVGWFEGVAPGAGADVAEPQRQQAYAAFAAAAQAEGMRLGAGKALPEPFPYHFCLAFPVLNLAA